MRFLAILLLTCGLSLPLAAQTSLSRAEAIRTALTFGARLGIARADSLVASAAVVSARAIPNPALTTSYSKSVPNYHFNFDVPFDFPLLRALRVRAAQTGLDAATLRLQFNRAMIAMEADTAYTRAIAARDRLALSRRNALDADSLLHMVERRRDAGDASDLDVELARVNAGQQANVTADDSLTLVSTLLDLQSAIGILSERADIVPADSLGEPPEGAIPAATNLDTQAAQLSLEAAALNARLQRRSIWSQLSLALGFETGDPDQHGLLPTFGIGIGLPLFDRNRGAIAQADAERIRAQAELDLARVQASNALAHALREREADLAKVARDRALLTSANRVAALSLTAYREGASTLPNVLEAQRSARDILKQYIDDLAAAWIATAELRVFSLTSATAP